MGLGCFLAAACAQQRHPETEMVGVSESRDPVDRTGPEGAPGGAPASNGAKPPLAAPAPAGSATAGDHRLELPDDWPSDTRSLSVRDTAHVRSAPLDRAAYIGKVTSGTRVGWQRSVAPDPEDPAVTRTRRRRKGEPCLAWVEILPRGFLCKTQVTPSHEEPYGVHQPVVRSGRITPDEYFKVMADETKVFKTADDVRADVVDKLVSTKVMLVGQSVLHVDETTYLKTDHGLIDAAALAKFWPSDFAGVNLREGTPKGLPFAWVFFERGGRRPSVYPAPDKDAKPVRAAARREIVTPLEENGGFVRIADGEWIERKHLRVATAFAPPPGAGTATDEQWIDVDLDEQVLVAYEGATPVFATLVSTGGRKNPTPAATYRVRAKAATTAMAGDAKVPNRYEVSAVPWAVRFADGFFIHGVYWHDGFGGARSHGCVNVSPKDAAFIFDWVRPAVPEGWSEVEVYDGGVIVRVHDHQNVDPKPFDYSREASRGEEPPASNRF
jgi:lipoprotein-anchoring transpeptidase ErfK/SrfK